MRPRPTGERRVVMLLPSDITYDTRVQRSARTLAAGGWEVTVAHVSQDGHATASADGYRLVGLPWPAFDDRVEAARGAVRRATSKRQKLEAALGRQPPAPADAERLEAARKKEAARRRTLKRAVVDGKVGVPTPLRRAWLAVLRRERPQVIHVHDQAGLATAFAGRGPATAVVYDAHEHTLGKDHKPGRRRPLERYLRRRVPAAEAVITVSAALAQTLQREFELRTPPILLHNLPSTAAARPAPYDLRERIGVDAATPVLVYAGAMTRRRLVGTVFRALADLPRVHLAMVLLRERPDVEAVADELGVGDRVHILPPVAPDELVATIAPADIGINPLDRYGNGDVALPNKLFEYLHAGLPMVVSDVPEMAAFVARHRLGEIAPPHDPEAWARAIDRLLTDPAAYTGDPAERARLRREWSWESEAPVLLELYERFAAGREAAA